MFLKKKKGKKEGGKKKTPNLIVPLLFWLPRVVYMPLCAYIVSKTIVDKFLMYLSAHHQNGAEVLSIL